ncbi:hypothetical protein ASB7_14720 [Helicobacter ailurogastricus]|nr:hypothetical protein ASB7_14720 [Helicobacter ailurogastricus]
MEGLGHVFFKKILRLGGFTARGLLKACYNVPIAFCGLKLTLCLDVCYIEAFCVLYDLALSLP